MQFLMGKDFVFLEELKRLIGNKCFERIDSVSHIGQFAFFCFLRPGIVIVISVEDDAVMLLVGFLDDRRCLGIFVFGLFEPTGDFIKRFCGNSIQSHIRA